MLQSLAWILQFSALVVVGMGFLVGLVYDEIRTELAMLAVGGGLFLLGRWLAGRDGE